MEGFTGFLESRPAKNTKNEKPKNLHTITI